MLAVATRGRATPKGEFPTLVLILLGPSGQSGKKVALPLVFSMHPETKADRPNRRRRKVLSGRSDWPVSCVVLLKSVTSTSAVCTTTTTTKKQQKQLPWGAALKLGCANGSLGCWAGVGKHASWRRRRRRRQHHCTLVNSAAICPCSFCALHGCREHRAGNGDGVGQAVCVCVCAVLLRSFRLRIK